MHSCHNYHPDKKKRGEQLYAGVQPKRVVPKGVVSIPCHGGHVTRQTSKQDGVDSCAHLRFHGLAFLAMVVEQVQHDRKASAKC